VIADDLPGRTEVRDPRRPPPWLARALLMVVTTGFLAVFAWRAFTALSGIGLSVLIAFFVALALEPMALWLVRHGWRRELAALATLVGSVTVALVLVALFGNLFVQQVLALLASVPGMWADLQSWLVETFDVTLPTSDDLIRTAVTKWGDDVASGVVFVGSTVISGIFTFTTVLLVTYYLMAAGPRFRASVCAWLTPGRQVEVLHLWEVTQVKISDFIRSRVVLAALSSSFTFIFLTVIGTSYAMPLALFTGLVSQFVPTIGTYIGGALPVVVALTTQGPAQAIAVLVFVVLYQQLENFVFSPKISSHALEMNPAVSFLVVLGAGAVFGPVGSFLGLPVAATIQAVGTTYVRRHEIIDSQMLRDPARSEHHHRVRASRPSPPPPSHDEADPPL
jgi:predicted PurR-regulated permease PerM